MVIGCVPNGPNGGNAGPSQAGNNGGSPTGRKPWEPGGNGPTPIDWPACTEAAAAAVASGALDYTGLREVSAAELFSAGSDLLERAGDALVHGDGFFSRSRLP